MTAITDMGKARGNNEDAVAVCSNLETRQWVGEGPCRSDCSRHAIALVADGLGGENAGEVASAIVIDTFADLQPETDYEVRIRAVNSDGATPWASATSRTTRMS